MKKEIANPFPDRRCFFCGADNPQGLGLRFFHDDATGETSTEYVPEERFVGQGDILHGAIQMGLLDELMGWACVAHTGEMAVTADLRCRFLRPLRIAGPRACRLPHHGAARPQGSYDGRTDRCRRRGLHAGHGNVPRLVPGKV
jgi:hypothetical protein